MSQEELKAGQLTVGQSTTYEIAGRSLKLKPMTLGRMKKATLIFAEKSDDSMEIVARYIMATFDNGENKELSIEWITENMTLPEAQKIIDDSRIVNGLGSFFPKGPSETATEGPNKISPQERAVSELTPIHLD